MLRKHYVFIGLLIALLTLPGIQSIAQFKPEFSASQKLSGPINSEAEEGLPYVTPDGQMLYFVRTFHASNVGGIGAGQDIWYSVQKNGKWTEPVNVIPNINDISNNAIAGVSVDGQKVFLKGTYINKAELDKGVSYSKTTGNGDWARPVPIKVPKLYIKGNYYGVYMNPSEDILIISMLGKKSMGEEDLYVCLKDGEGKWQAPIHLGNAINSNGYEIGPYLSKDGKTLYFASNGHGGYGGVDIFSSTRLDDTWTNWSTPANLGNKINSDGFDAFFSTHKDMVYFASNRAGDLSDIYSSKILNYTEEVEAAPMLANNFSTIEGIVEYNNIPASNISLKLVDSEGTEVQSLKTDENGRFQLEQLAQGEQFYMSIAEERSSIPADSRFFLLNEQGEKIKEILRLTDGTFPFQALPKEDIVGMSLYAEDDLTSMQGMLDYNDVPLRNVEVDILDERNQVIQTTTTDENGLFFFDRLRAGKTFSLATRGANGSSVPAGSQFYLMNQQDKRVSESTLDEYGRFTYSALGKDAIAGMATLPEIDFTSVQGMFEYNSLPLANVGVNLVDENDNIIRSGITDKDGLFFFDRIRPGKSMHLVLADGSIVPDGTKAYMLNERGERIAVNGFSGDKRFIYKTLSRDELASMDVLEEGDDASMSAVEGLFEYNKLPASGVKVNLLDEEDNIIQSTFTNAQGRFIFEKLDPEKNYLVKIAEDDEKSFSNFYLFFLDGTGGKMAMERNSDNAGFEFATLPADATEGLGTGEMADNSKGLSNMTGFYNYKNLPASKVTLELLDENDNVVGLTKTDADGKFKFSALPTDNNYAIRIAEKDAAQFDKGTIVLTDGQGAEVAQMEQDKGTKGTYSLEQLRTNYFSQVVAAEEVDKGPSKQDKGRVNTVRLRNYNGIVLANKANGGEDLAVRTTEVAPVLEEPVVAMVETPQVPVVEAPKPEKPIVEKAPEPKKAPKAEKVEPKSAPKRATPAKPVLVPKAGEVAVLFGYNSWKLTNNDYLLLRGKVLPVLEQNPNTTLEIHGHTDNTGSAYNNQKVSEFRAVMVKRYLVLKGISASRIKTKGFGEERPVADNAGREERKLNRRAELIFKK